MAQCTELCNDAESRTVSLGVRVWKLWERSSGMLRRVD